MNKLKTLLVCAALAMGLGAQADNKLTAQDVTAKPGGQGELVISMENDFEVQAFDFRLYLPEGVTVGTDAEGYYDCTLSSRCSNHSSTILLSGDATYFLFGISSPSRKVQPGTGVVLTVPLQVSSSIANGTTLEATMKKVYLASPDGYTGADCPDVTFSIVVDEVAVGITSVDAARQPQEVYTLSGQRVSQPAKGLYIVNGKKVVK